MKEYTIHSESWYFSATRSAKTHPSLVDDITFGEYSKDGGCKWECKAEFFNFDNTDECMKIGIFDDNFVNWKWIKPVFNELSKYTGSINRKKFCNILESLGYKDATQRKQ